MDERVYLVIDGVDGRVHHVEFPDGSHLKDTVEGDRYPQAEAERTQR